jgi:Tol biopolymer transport system component
VTRAHRLASSILLGALAVPIAAVGASPAELPKIAFVSDRDGDHDIYLMNLDGTDQVRLSDNPEDDLYPAWSPDGQMIAFESRRDGNPEIYVMDRDGTAVTRLTDDPSADTQPVWSPDGQTIVFASDRRGTMDLFTMDAGGGSVARLTRAAGDEYPSDWSEDGRRILFHAAVSDFEQFILFFPSRVLIPLTDNDAFDGGATWLSGRGMVFVTKRDLNDEIYTMMSDGTRLRRLTDDPAIDRYPDGSADFILFDSKRDGNFEIYAMQPDGTGETRLTEEASADWFARLEPLAAIPPGGVRARPAWP